MITLGIMELAGCFMVVVVPYVAAFLPSENSSSRQIMKR